MKKLLILTIALSTLVACKKKEEKVEETEPQTTTETSEATEKKEEWTVLFDGSNADQWRGYGMETMPAEWTIEEGTLAFTPGPEGGKNIITKDKYTSFVLSLEWKISEAGNSGIFWGVFEAPKFKEPYMTGPEIQVLDNLRHPDAKIAGKLHQAGALYDMVEPSEDTTKPAGEWNLCVITIDQKANKGTVVLNGKEVTTFPLHGKDWEDMVNNSKFKDWDGFGEYNTGHIGLQDHSDKVWYRNIKIKRL